MNRFMGLNLEDWAPEELWAEAYSIVQEAATKTTTKKRKYKKAKRLSEEPFQIAEEKRSKRQGRKG